MKTAAAYTGVVLIWSTTPLAIKWSNSSLSFLEAVTVRMSFALVGALLIAAVLDKRIFQKRSDWKPMIIGAFKLYPGMLLVYWSAQHISSGLVSVLFGATPFFVGIFSIFILKENHFNFARVVALILALVGLVVLHVDQLNTDVKAAWGALGVLLSAMLFALSTVALKRVGGSVDPVRQLAGSLVIAAPLFLITWMVLDGKFPSYVDARSISGVVYLVIAGSILGGLAFYYVLRKCSVSTVSLIPLITPVAALIFGHLVDGEKVEQTALVGIAFVMVSLALYQGVLQSVLITLSKFKLLVRKKVSTALADIIELY